MLDQIRSIDNRRISNDVLTLLTKLELAEIEEYLKIILGFYLSDDNLVQSKNREWPTSNKWAIGADLSARHRWLFPQPGNHIYVYRR